MLFFHKKEDIHIGYPLILEHETGFEPATLALARRYSTTEPLVHTYLQNHILKSSFTVFSESTTQTFLDKPSTD